MSTLALLRAFLYADEWDATADSNNVMLKAAQPPLDGTTFRTVITNGGWSEVGASGLRKLDYTFNGFWGSSSTTAQDPESFNQLGGASRVWSTGLDETETAPAFIWQGRQFSYQTFGEHGANAPFSVAVKPTDGITGLARGQLAAKLQSKSATGQLGSVCQLGAPTSTQYVYASLHVFSAGTTITVQVQSDDNLGMSSPTTRATIGPLTVAGGTYLTRVAGPFVGEQYWRFNVSAITGTFSVAGVIAVQ